MEKSKLSFKSDFVHREQRARFGKAIEGLCSSSRAVNAIFVEGPSGSGKTQLVRSSFAVHESKLWVATAKFERRGHWDPLSIFRSFIGGITEQITKSPQPDRVDACREALKSEVASYPRNKDILLDMVPACAELFGRPNFPAEKTNEKIQSESSTVFSTDDVNSTRLALRSFLRAVSSVLPTVLLFDDIMWSDKDSLEIFEFLLRDASLSNILLCATLWDKIDKTLLFCEWQTRFQAELKDEVQTIKVKNLEVTEVQCLLSDLLHLNEGELADLAELLKVRTNGNLFHLAQMLDKLCSLNLLRCEFVGLTKWTYSVEDIQRLTTYSDNVCDLVSSRIKELEHSLQELLKFAACFGARVEVKALEVIQPVMLGGIADIHSLLDRACQEMILIRVSQSTYRFAHDSIQAAAYALLSLSGEAKQIHQRIADLLLHNELVLEDQTLTFVCADQLKRGCDTFNSKEDRIDAAQLCLAAGIKAAAISAFMMASDFFKLGINAMGGHDAFDLDHDLAVKLYSMYAKIEQCGTNPNSISESKKAAETVLAHAATEKSKVSAFRTLLSCFLAANQLDELIDFGLGLCAKLGEKIPKNPNARQVRREVEKGRKVLLKTSNAQVLSLPPIQDKNKELCMNVLFELAMPAYYVGNHLLHYAIVSRMNKITLEHGLSKWSPKSFALSGQHFTANYNDFKEGYRYAQLALILLGDYTNTKRGGSVVFHVAIIKACIEPATSCLDLLLSGYRISMEAGHINFAVTNIFNYCWTFFYSGLPFEPLLHDIEKFSSQMLDYKRHYWFLMVLPLWQCLLNLSGQSEDCSNMEMGNAIEKESLVGGNPKGAGRQTLLSYWMQLSFYLGNMDKATELYEELRGADMGAFKATMFFNARIFFFALIEIHNYRVTGKGECRKNAKKYRDMLRKHVSGGAINLVSKVQLLDAEIAKRKVKNSSEVLQKYRGAIASATRSGFLQDAALFNHLCGNYCQTTTALEDYHKDYILKAHEHYTSWGASEVAKSLRERYPGIFVEGSGFSLQSSFKGHRSSMKFGVVAEVAKRHSFGLSDVSDEN